MTDLSICVVFDSYRVWEWLLYNKIIIQVYRLHNSWIGRDSGTKQNDGVVKVIVLHEQWICEEQPELPQYPQQWLIAAERSVIKNAFFTAKAMKKENNEAPWSEN